MNNNDTNQELAQRHLERGSLQITYLPTVSSLPLLYAVQHGYFSEQGLDIDLQPAPSWSGVKELMVYGKVDAAIMSLPMLLACHLGIDGKQADIGLVSLLSMNGQALTLALRHHDLAGPAAMRGFTIGVPYRFSMEYYLLCHYLASCGLDPIKDVDIVEVAPARMHYYLKQEWVDAVFAPEPFCQLSVNQGVGLTYVQSRDIWDGHPCCGLGMPRGVMDQHPETVRGLQAGLIRAVADLEHLELEALAELSTELCEIGLMDLEDRISLEQVLVAGHGGGGAGSEIFCAPIAHPEPMVWMLAQMQRWGQLAGRPAYQAIADEVLAGSTPHDELSDYFSEDVLSLAMPDSLLESVAGDAYEQMRQLPYSQCIEHTPDLIAYSLDGALRHRLNEFAETLAAAAGGIEPAFLAVESEGVVGHIEQLINEVTQSLCFSTEIVKELRESVDQQVLERTTDLQFKLKRAEELKTLALAGSQTKSEMLAAMSHEIKSPMHGVLGMTQVLLDMHLTDEQRDYVQIIHQSGKTLLSVINDILDFSKVEAGKLQLDQIPFDLERAVYEVAELLQAKAREKELELVLLYSPRLPKHFVGDPGRVRQILMNLVGNAVKFTTNGYVLIEVSALQQEQGSVVVSFQVEDTGLGIDGTTKEKLFESFRKGDDDNLLKYDGGGLGLTICDRLIGLMGGELAVESELGRGSVFSFSIPLKTAEKPESLPLSDLGGVRILVVEPSPLYGAVQHDYLESFAMRPVVVPTSEEAVTRLRKASKSGNAFQICLVADPMRECDTLDFATRVSNDVQIEKLALVVLSAEAQRGDAERFKQAGYTAYLTRPMLRDSFRKTLAAVLASRNLHLPTAPIITKHQVDELGAYVERTKEKLDGHVLLAEDIFANQAIAKAMLRKLGLDVTTVNNGSEAVKAWREGGFDIILMDRQMPELDGIEATRLIRRAERELKVDEEIPIIALSANPLASDKRACVDVGMTDFLAKPLVKEQLIEVLKLRLPSTGRSHHSGEHQYEDDGCIDWRALKDLEQMMGSEFDEMVPSFVEVAEAIIGQLSLFDPQDDCMTIERLANSLASASAGVGAVGLLSLARMLEMQAKEGRVVALGRQVKELGDAFVKAQTVLEEHHRMR